MPRGGRDTNTLIYHGWAHLYVSRVGATILHTYQQPVRSIGRVIRSTWPKVQAPIVGTHRARLHRSFINTASTGAIARTLAHTSSSLSSTKQDPLAHHLYVRRGRATVSAAVNTNAT